MTTPSYPCQMTFSPIRYAPPDAPSGVEAFTVVHPSCRSTNGSMDNLPIASRRLSMDFGSALERIFLAWLGVFLWLDTCRIKLYKSFRLFLPFSAQPINVRGFVFSPCRASGFFTSASAKATTPTQSSSSHLFKPLSIPNKRSSSSFSELLRAFRGRPRDVKGGNGALYSFTMSSVVRRTGSSLASFVSPLPFFAVLCSSLEWDGLPLMLLMFSTVSSTFLSLPDETGSLAEGGGTTCSVATTGSLFESVGTSMGESVGFGTSLSFF
mmetsp:Transcript_25211/g.41343  ORF Transcript_25211/g.41343 Transcript_25211/m.41343 type:complete len:267 (+) Transcript_25211:2814-3614(+)